MIRNRILVAELLLASAAFLPAQNLAFSEEQSVQAQEAAKGDPDYERGLSALDARNWEEAISSFRESASHKRGNADAALYWLAYAQDHAGQREQALITTRQLQQNYASSRWINDAKALEVEIHGQNGNPVSPSSEPDEELKLLALNGLMTSDRDKAIPILRNLLASNNSEKIKERALFVLAQNPSPEARKLIVDTARGVTTPDLQIEGHPLHGHDGRR